MGIPQMHSFVALTSLDSVICAANKIKTNAVFEKSMGQNNAASLSARVDHRETHMQYVAYKLKRTASRL